MQTHLVSKIMHQNVAVVLRQINYGKKSFIAFSPWYNGKYKTTLDEYAGKLKLSMKFGYCHIGGRSLIV